MTYGCPVSLKEDADLDLAELKQLLKRIEKTIHDQPNRVRFAMNAFVVSVGGYVKSLTDTALRTAAKIGKLPVDMGETACKVPNAAEYIKKMQDRGSIGKKRQDREMLISAAELENNRVGNHESDSTRAADVKTDFSSGKKRLPLGIGKPAMYGRRTQPSFGGVFIDPSG